MSITSGSNGLTVSRDFIGAKEAGLRAKLLVRPGQEAAHPNMATHEFKDNDEILQSLTEAINFIEKSSN